MNTWHGSVFRIIGPLWEEPQAPHWIVLIKGWKYGNLELAGDSRRHDVILMDPQSTISSANGVSVKCMCAYVNSLRLNDASEIIWPLCRHSLSICLAAFFFHTLTNFIPGLNWPVSILTNFIPWLNWSVSIVTHFIARLNWSVSIDSTDGLALNRWQIITWIPLTDE